MKTEHWSLSLLIGQSETANTVKEKIRKELNLRINLSVLYSVLLNSEKNEKNLTKLKI